MAMELAVSLMKTIWGVYNTVKDDQKRLEGTCRRLNDLLRDLQTMEASNTLVRSDLLDAYIEVARRFLVYMEGMKQQRLVYRLWKHREMKEELSALDGELDTLFKMYHLAMGAHAVAHNQSQDAKLDAILHRVSRLLPKEQTDEVDQCLQQIYIGNQAAAQKLLDITRGDKRAQRALADYGRISVLLELATQVSVVHSASRINVIETIASIAFFETVQSSIASMNGLFKLVNMLKSCVTSLSEKEAASRVISRLLFEDKNDDAFCTDACGGMLLEFLNDQETETSVKTQLLIATMNATQRDKPRDFLMKCSSSRVLLRILVSCGPDEMIAKAGMTVCNLLISENHRHTLAGWSSIEALHRVFLSNCRPRSHRILLMVLRGFQNFACSDDLRRRIFTDAVGQQLIHLIRFEPNGQVKERAALVISRLALDADVSEKLCSSESCLTALVDLISAGTHGQLQHATFALANFSIVPQNADRLGSGGVVQAAIHAMSHPESDATIQRASLKIFLNIITHCSRQVLQSSIHQQSTAMSELVASIAQSSSDQRCQALAAAAHAAFHHRGSSTKDADHHSCLS